jgi:tRNA-splicing ligase RtcB (3'-phosphate/5'-hydroxy nucleic acid ligase)
MDNKMFNVKDFARVSDYEWEIPQQGKMLVPVRVIASRKILESALGDESMQQAVHAACLPGVMGHVMVMPDMHQGYGFPIGGVAAMQADQGVISPGAIGYDINCGVRLLSSQLDVEEAEPWLEPLISALDHACPSGMKRKSSIPLTMHELDEILEQGSAWLIKQGMASQTDIDHTESHGGLIFADPDQVSRRAKERGLDQLGTLGSGNHFLEIGYVDQVFDEAAANAMGLYLGKITVLIHCGSRGLGHQVCGDYLQTLQQAMQKQSIVPPNRDLSYAYLDSLEGKHYLAAMGAAANYAFTNRQVLASQTARVFNEVLSGKVNQRDLHLVYDVAHNMGNLETHIIDGKETKVCIHRKGATRAFGPGRMDIPAEYREYGQPVLVPGSMGTASWVLAGTQEGMLKSFGSSCHGAGRSLSRKRAKEAVDSRALLQQLQKRSIHVKTASLQGLAEEAPQAYKDVDDVVEGVIGAGIARKVARLLPLAVIKG